MPNTPSARQIAYKPSEKQLQAQIVQGLEARGYVVRQLGHITRQTRCPNCGAWHTPHVGYGNDPGVPDLLVSRPGWFYWVGLEVKTPIYRTVLGTIPGGRLRREQRDLVELGLTRVIRSLEDALSALEEVS